MSLSVRLFLTHRRIIANAEVFLVVPSAVSIIIVPSNNTHLDTFDRDVDNEPKHLR